jgi:hypothetical protein
MPKRHWRAANIRRLKPGAKGELPPEEGRWVQARCVSVANGVAVLEDTVGSVVRIPLEDLERPLEVEEEIQYDTRRGELLWRLLVGVAGYVFRRKRRRPCRGISIGLATPT